MRILENKIKDPFTELTETYLSLLDDLLRRSLYKETRRKLVETQVVGFYEIGNNFKNIQEEIDVLINSDKSSEELEHQWDILVYQSLSSITVIRNALTLYVNAPEKDKEAKFNKFLYKLIIQAKSITQKIETFKLQYL